MSYLEQVPKQPFQIGANQFIQNADKNNFNHFQPAGLTLAEKKNHKAVGLPLSEASHVSALRIRLAGIAPGPIYFTPFSISYGKTTIGKRGKKVSELYVPPD